MFARVFVCGPPNVYPGAVLRTLNVELTLTAPWRLVSSVGRHDPQFCLRDEGDETQKRDVACPSSALNKHHRWNGLSSVLPGFLMESFITICTLLSTLVPNHKVLLRTLDLWFDYWIFRQHQIKNSFYWKVFKTQRRVSILCLLPPVPKSAPPSVSVNGIIGDNTFEIVCLSDVSSRLCSESVPNWLELRHKIQFFM